MFFNTFVNPIALDAIGWRYYIVFIVVLVLFAVTAFFFYPETKGYSLEQVAVIFDGPVEREEDEEKRFEEKVNSVHEERAAA